MAITTLSPSVSEYFDSVADDYSEHYNPDNLMDMSRPYPANYIRLQMLKDSFKDRKNIIDVGCGDGTALLALNAERKHGFDISPRMVEVAQTKLGRRVILADLMHRETYGEFSYFAPFDGLIACGVMPHIEDTEQALRNMQALVKGKVFIEFRNDLFNLFAMNRLTAEFISRLVERGSESVLDCLLDRLPYLPMPRPYDAILSKFHNPFEVEQLFKRLGFADIKLLFYHYHVTLPWLDDHNPENRKAALAMERQPQTWKSMFQCSAFVVEAWT